ncbi:hypothetical protein BAR24066_02793 [Burkholderia arboris]|uniref:Uncharacterized protein n=1 Tax=Burkholderia arboris TaxID=488730 RepID=A0A9Q9SI12_9BURK|nr:hypothetical protein BAR24066_02793 [Burkholderia arboris]
MFTGRRYGGSDARSSPSTKILPEVAVSSPASMRSSVDLPQPELPSSANSSFFAIVRFTLSTAVLSPNFFTTFSMRTKASFGLSGSIVARSAASGVLNESRFMMVRVGQVSESRASGATGRTRARCRWSGIERLPVRNEWRNETGLGERHGDRQPFASAGIGRRAGCHEHFIGFHRAFRTFLSSPGRIFKRVKNLLDRGFPFRTLNGIDVWGGGKTGRDTAPVQRRGHPADRAPPGETQGGENEQPGRLPRAAGAPRG